MSTDSDDYYISSPWKPLGRLMMELVQCGILQVSNSSTQAMDLLRVCGAKFVASPYKGTTVDTNQYVGEDGNIIVPCEFTHGMLSVDLRTTLAKRYHGLHEDSPPLGNFGYFVNSKTICVRQDAEFPDQRSPDNIATGLLALSLQVYPHARPCYGSVDEMGWNAPDFESVDMDQYVPKFLFWANIFGPAMVDRIGREFILNAPGWHVVPLDDGGLLHVATESYHEWWLNGHPELQAYFRQRFPEIEIFRAEPVPI